LHAAGVYELGQEECCADYVVSSYTPTLDALLRAQKLWPLLNTKTSRLALIAAAKTHDPTLPVLHSVQEEMNHVISIANKAELSVDKNCLQDAATLEHTAASLKSSTLVHIACHGVQNQTDALSSGFCLQDGILTVSRLIELDLKNAFFAFLSACETAKGDSKQPDQTVHLSAALLFVGYRSIIATMW
jgi:CHAT domain-containing protein